MAFRPDDDMPPGKNTVYEALRTQGYKVRPSTGSWMTVFGLSLQEMPSNVRTFTPREEVDDLEADGMPF